MEKWRDTFRRGVAPSLSLAGLEALLVALKHDDPRLIQGATTTPPPLMSVQEWPVEAACAIGYSHWIGDGKDTVGTCEEAFARTCFEIDQLVNEPAGCRHWLNWFDETPRPDVLNQLLPEVELAIRGKVQSQG